MNNEEGNASAEAQVPDDKDPGGRIAMPEASSAASMTPSTSLGSTGHPPGSSKQHAEEQEVLMEDV